MRLPLVLAVAALLFLASCSSAPRPATGTPPKFNLVDGYDVNGFFLNPSWSDSAAANISVSPHLICEKPPLGPGCNDQRLAGSGVDTAEKNFWLALFHRHVAYETCEFATQQGFLPGHVNLGVATFEGPLTWTALSFDGDYNFILHPAKGGLTKTSSDCIGIEFGADETLGQYDCLTPWWREYAEMARERRANDLLVKDNGGKAPFAVVTGLLGFNCEHGCVTELHPVYILAIRRSGGAREEWAFFVRNWGSEGWCSLENHALETTRLRVLLPYPGAQNPNVLMEVKSSFQLYQSAEPSIWEKLKRLFNRTDSHHARVDVVAVEGGVLVTFDLPDRRLRPVIEGELSFRWRTSEPLADFEAVACTPEQGIPNIEGAFTQLQTSLPPEQTASFFAKPSRVVQPSSSFIALSHERAAAQIALPAPLSIAASASFDSTKQARDRTKLQEIRELCAALGRSEDFKRRDDFQIVCGRAVHP